MSENNNNLAFQRVSVALILLAAMWLTACVPFPQRVADELEPSADVSSNNYAPDTPEEQE